MKIKFNKNFILSAAAIASIVLGLIWLAWFWQFRKIKETVDNIQKEQLDSLVREERSQRISKLEKELGNVEASARQMNSALIAKEDAVSFLKDLENIARETQNSIKISVSDLTKLKPAQKKTAPAASSDDDEDTKGAKPAQQKMAKIEPTEDFSGMLGFSLEVTGKYNSFIDFLTKIENMPYFVRVYNLEIIPADEKPASIGMLVETGEGQSEEENNISAKMIIMVYTNGK